MDTIPGAGHEAAGQDTMGRDPIGEDPIEGYSDRRPWKRAVWGILLIVLGVGFLLERLGVLDLPPFGHLWPMAVLAISAIKFIERRPGSGVMFALLGAWFFAVNEGWWNLDYENSWGLALVAVGVGMVIRALSGEDARNMRELRRRLRRRLGGLS